MFFAKHPNRLGQTKNPHSLECTEKVPEQARKLEFLYHVLPKSSRTDGSFPYLTQKYYESEGNSIAEIHAFAILSFLADEIVFYRDKTRGVDGSNRERERIIVNESSRQ